MAKYQLTINKEKLIIFESSSKVQALEQLIKLNSIIFNIEEILSLDITKITIPAFRGISNIRSSLNSWQKDIFDCICYINKPTFSLNEIYKYNYYLKILHPKSNTIEAQSRRTLQELRDLKLIEFISPGQYKVLFDLHS